MIIVYSMLNTILIFLAFMFGLHYGSKVKKNEVIDKPELNPVKVVKKTINESKAEAKKNKEQMIDDINLHNIDNYNGTELGQQDIPR